MSTHTSIDDLPLTQSQDEEMHFALLLLMESVVESLSSSLLRFLKHTGLQGAGTSSLRAVWG